MGCWCGIHSLNNALQYSCFNPTQALQEARRTLQRELEWAKIDRTEFDWSLGDPSGNLDVAIVRSLLETSGHKTFFVRTFGQALRLVTHHTKGGGQRKAFICHVRGSHYIALTQYQGAWWCHDSMEPRAVSVTASQILFLFFPVLCKGNRGNFGRRLLYFEPI